MANLKADSPLCRRIVHSFLDFLNSVEPSSVSDAESLEVAKDCLSEAFKIDPSATSSVAKSESLVQIFSSKTGDKGIKSDQIHDEYQSDTSSTNIGVDTKISGTPEPLDGIKRQDTRSIGVLEDELFGKFFGALEKIHYFGTTANGDDEHALERATHLFHKALMEMKKSGSEEIGLKNLADTFKVQGNKAMQAKVYSEAIELYTIAIALCEDNAVYYCNRAAAYTQTNQYAEATRDCHQAIAIDPKYSKAYSRLGFTYYAQGNYRDALEKGFLKALRLDPNNESIKGNIQAAEQKVREELQRAHRGQTSSSGSEDNSGRSHGSVPFSMNVNGRSFDFGSILRDMGEAGVNVGDEMPNEIRGTIRTVMEMFSDGTATQHHVNSQDNSNGTN